MCTAERRNAIAASSKRPYASGPAEILTSSNEMICILDRVRVRVRVKIRIRVSV